MRSISKIAIPNITFHMGKLYATLNIFCVHMGGEMPEPLISTTGSIKRIQNV